MLADDNVLLDELGEDLQSVLAAADRQVLVVIDPNSAATPAAVVANPPQVI